MTSKNIECKTDVIYIPILQIQLQYIFTFKYIEQVRNKIFRVIKNISNILREYNGKIEIKDQSCVKKSTFSVTKR